MKQYVVDAFTDKVFSGNPAAIMVMDKWLDDNIMKKIAMENNLSETAFIVKDKDTYNLRWFTPAAEIDLCGHATLASAYVILNYIDKDAKEVSFNTLSGILTVKKQGDLFEMDFPSYDLKKIDIFDEVESAIGIRPIDICVGRDLLAILEKEEDVKNLNINVEKVKGLPGLLLNVSAKGKEFDCVSRSFAPKLNVTEDPVCGSGHCHIIPYWAKKLNKNKFIAYQASPRSGILYCEVEDDRIKLSGKAVLYSIADINSI